MYYLMARRANGDFYRWINQQVESKSVAFGIAEDEMDRDKEIGKVDIIGHLDLVEVVRPRRPGCENRCDNQADWIVTFHDDIIQNWCTSCAIGALDQKTAVRIVRIAYP